ncbi:hypothetical protein D3C76_998700 [compost metagenome]
MPAVEHRVQPLVGALLVHRLATVRLGGAHQMLQGVLAQLHLFLQQGQVVLQGRHVAMFLAQLLEQHAHGRQRRAQLVGGAGGLGGHGEQLLVAHVHLAALRLQLFLAAQDFGHARDEEGDQRRRQGEAQPHAVDQQRLALAGGHFQRVEEHQQQGVGRQRQAGQGKRIEPGQGRCGDGQRHQVIGDEGVGRAPGEIQQHAVDDQVDAQLHRVFQLGHRPGAAQA